MVLYFYMPQEESKEKRILKELFPEEGKVPIVETRVELEVPPETHLEKIEKELHTMPTIRDDWGRIMAQPPAPQKVKIQLPITRQQYVQGLSQPVVDSLRWLVVWIGRLVKMVPEKISFRSAKA